MIMRDEIYGYNNIVRYGTYLQWSTRDQEPKVCFERASSVEQPS